MKSSDVVELGVDMRRSREPAELAGGGGIAESLLAALLLPAAVLDVAAIALLGGLLVALELPGLGPVSGAGLVAIHVLGVGRAVLAVALGTSVHRSILHRVVDVRRFSIPQRPDINATFQPPCQPISLSKTKNYQKMESFVIQTSL